MTTTIQVPETARRVLIGVNPHAGAQNRQSLVAELCERLSGGGLQAKVVQNIDELAGEAERLFAAGELRAVVSAGGDGTLRLIADRTPACTPLAILPLGTENLLARYLEHPPDPTELARIIEDGLTMRLDAGRAGGRLFTLMTGCGFDADVVRRLHETRNGHIHHLSYVQPILDAIRTYDYPELRVYCVPEDAPPDAELTKEITARWVFVINLPRYAGGLSFSPQASGIDGLLDVCTFKEGSLLSGLYYLTGVMLGQHEGMEDFVRVRTRRLRVEAAGKAPYQIDGDPGGELPVEINALPGRLTMLIAAQWAGKQGL
jgi:diacylglycerol kinase family enzyme